MSPKHRPPSRLEPLFVGEKPNAFEMRTGEWRIDLSAAVAKSVATASVSTLALQLLGQSSIPATVLSIVVPFLFELERIEVDAGDVYLIGRIVAAHGTGPHHLTTLYEALSEDLRRDLPVHEFAGLIDRLQQAGLATAHAEGVTLVDGVRNRRRVRLRFR